MLTRMATRSPLATPAPARPRANRFDSSSHCRKVMDSPAPRSLYPTSSGNFAAIVRNWSVSRSGIGQTLGSGAELKRLLVALVLVLPLVPAAAAAAPLPGAEGCPLFPADSFW